MDKYFICVLVVVSLSSQTVRSQNADENDSQDRTLGLFRHRNRYNGYNYPPGSNRLFGGLLGSLFGGPSYNPYFGSGFGYPGGYSPYFGAPAPGGFLGPGLGPGYYAPGFGGYRQFPGGYSGRS